MNFTLSFCESMHTINLNSWHIRILTKKGRKLGGGGVRIDTESLCGKVRIGQGWDLEIQVSLNHPAICKKCLKKVRGH